MNETTHDTTALFTDKSRIQARALYIGERLDLRSLEQTNRLATFPLFIPTGEDGYVVLFRYGVVVLFHVQPLEEVSFLKQLEPLVSQPFDRHETETADIQVSQVSAKGDEGATNGIVFVREISVERLQVVADILAKSVVLAHYEVSIASAFDAIEPFAIGLKQRVFVRDKSKTLTQYVGDTLLIQHKMVGRVEVTEKPELLWDRPELNRLYARLEDEYELVERHNGIERKLLLIARTVETELDILQNERTLRMEWYVVILIAGEILLSVYDIFFRRGG